MVKGYRASGISARWDGSYFRVSLDFFDYGTALGRHSEASDGSLQMTHPSNNFSDAIKTLKSDAEKIGIVFIEQPMLYVECDKGKFVPVNWEVLLQPVADAIGFQLVADKECGGFPE